VRKVAIEKFLDERSVRISFHRTFKGVGKVQATFLNFGENFVRRLPFMGDREGGENLARQTCEMGFRRVEKLIVGFRGRYCEEQRLHVNGPKTRSPLETLKAPGDVFGRG
jgi:hypothetical protein